jgi:hypothetical protein
MTYSINLLTQLYIVVSLHKLLLFLRIHFCHNGTDDECTADPSQDHAVLYIIRRIGAKPFFFTVKKKLDQI